MDEKEDSLPEFNALVSPEFGSHLTLSREAPKRPGSWDLDGGHLKTRSSQRTIRDSNDMHQPLLSSHSSSSTVDRPRFLSSRGKRSDPVRTSYRRSKQRQRPESLRNSLNQTHSLPDPNDNNNNGRHPKLNRLKRSAKGTIPEDEEPSSFRSVGRSRRKAHSSARLTKDALVDKRDNVRPYNLTIMSRRTLFLMSTLMYLCLAASVVWTVWLEQEWSVMSSRLDMFALSDINDSSILSDRGWFIDLKGYVPWDEIEINGTNDTLSIPELNHSSVLLHRKNFYVKNQYISTDLSIRPPENDNDHVSNWQGVHDWLSTNKFNLTVIVNVSSIHSSGESVFLDSYQGSTEAEFQCKGIPDSSEEASQKSGERGRCKESLEIWGPSSSWFPASWQTTMLTKYNSGRLRFDTLLFFRDFDILSLLHPELTDQPGFPGFINESNSSFEIHYKFQSRQFAQAEFYLKIVFASLTGVLLLCWIWGLGKFSRSEGLVAEQRWMIILFLATLLYQNPLTISELPAKAQRVSLVSSILLATAIFLFCVYWSLMIDSIREIKNVIELGMSYGFRSYAQKTLGFVVMYVSSLIFTVMADDIISRNRDSYDQYITEQSWNSHSVKVKMCIFFGGVWGLCCIVFLTWIIISIIRADRELAKLPYLQTRERQLSLRLFKHNTFLLLVFVTLVEVYTIWHNEGNIMVLVDPRRTNLAQYVVVSLYAYLVAFTYWPSSNQKIDSYMHGFEFGIASILCHLSWQAYLSPTERILIANSSPTNTADGGDTNNHESTTTVTTMKVNHSSTGSSSVINSRKKSRTLTMVNNKVDDPAGVGGSQSTRKMFRISRKTTSTEDVRHPRETTAFKTGEMTPEVFNASALLIDPNSIGFSSSGGANKPQSRSAAVWSRRTSIESGSLKIFDVNEEAKMDMLPLDSKAEGQRSNRDLLGDTDGGISDAKDTDMVTTETDADADEDTAPAPKWGIMDVDYYDLKLARCIQEKSQDLQCIIVTGEIFEKYSENGSTNQSDDRNGQESGLTRFFHNIRQEAANIGIRSHRFDRSRPRGMRNGRWRGGRRRMRSDHGSSDEDGSPLRGYGRAATARIRRNRGNGRHGKGYKDDTQVLIERRGDGGKGSRLASKPRRERSHTFAHSRTDLRKEMNREEQELDNHSDLAGGMRGLESYRVSHISAESNPLTLDHHLVDSPPGVLTHQPRSDPKYLRPARSQGNMLLDGEHQQISQNADGSALGNIANFFHGISRPTFGGIGDMMGLHNYDDNGDGKEKEDIAVAIRGTDSETNVRLDLQFQRTEVDPALWYGGQLDDVSIMQDPLWLEHVNHRRTERQTGFSSSVSGANGPGLANPFDIPYFKIHTGFFAAFRALRIPLINAILPEIDAVCQRGRKPRIYVTGHSLGGAIAQLCAMFLFCLFSHKCEISVYVYGCPRVGDGSFRSFMNEHIPNLYRVVFGGDLMTVLPSGMYGSYKHCGKEVIIDKYGHMIFQPGKGEKDLLPRRTSLADHSLDRYIKGLNTLCLKTGKQECVIELKESEQNSALARAESCVAVDMELAIKARMDKLDTKTSLFANLPGVRSAANGYDSD